MIHYLILSLLLFSCTSKPPGEKLFPYGVYHHEVALDVKGQSHNFMGVNKWTHDELTMVALGSFDVTLIKYFENLKSNKQEVYVNKNFLPLSDEKAKTYLGFLKKLYALDRSICDGKKCRESFFGQEFFFDLNDTNQVESIKFERGDVKVNVKVVGFEKAR